MRKEFEAQSFQQQQEMEWELRSASVGVEATDLERAVYRALQRRQIPFDFRSSMSGGRPGYQFGRQVADFVLWQLGIIIEVHGAYWHDPVGQADRDTTRDLVLQAEGWRVLYLPERIVRNALELERWLNEHVTYAGGNNTAATAVGVGGLYAGGLG
jgi:very-short-patch-repair endonuclease